MLLIQITIKILLSSPISADLFIIIRMEKSLDFDYIFKYILIGDSSVGKSTILSMFINNSYLSDSNPTMGVEFATKKIAVTDKIIKIQIWDTVS